MQPLRQDGDGAGWGVFLSRRTDWVVPLRACADAARSEVGGKAAGLGRMMAAGLPVPEGVCLTSAAFEVFRSGTPVAEVIAAAMHGIRENPVATGKLLRRIRFAIGATALPAKLAEAIAEASMPLFASGSLIVRSSSPDEDDEAASQAGGYFSSGEIADFERVCDAIRLCWASAFSDRALYYGKGRVRGNMAVVLQHWIRPCWSGVLFTRDPLREDDQGEPVAEVSAEGASVTAAEGTTVRLCLGAPSAPPDPAGVPGELRTALLSCVQPAEALVGCAADVEWVWDGGRLHLVQVRPEVRRSQQPCLSPTMVSLDDMDLVYHLPLGHCRALFMAKLLKKVWFRKTCADAGIPVFRIWYLVYGERDAERAAAIVASRADTTHVRLDWGDGQPMRVAGVALAAALQANAHRNVVGKDALSCLEVGEVLHGSVSGIATCLPDGQTLIQAAPSAVKGLQNGVLEPSVFVTGPDGEPRLERPATFTAVGAITEDGYWRAEPCPPYILRLSPSDLAEIARVTRIVSQALGEVRLEWCLDAGTVFVKDLSLESKALSTPIEGAVLSPGAASGRAVRIEDLREFHEVAHRYQISVVSNGQRQDRASQAVPVARLRALAEQHGPIVVVAEYPALGLIPTIPYVRGFVFQRGTLLCHLAIALREAGVPAVVLSDAPQRIREGEQLTISPAGVQHHAVRGAGVLS